MQASSCLRALGAPVLASLICAGLFSPLVQAKPSAKAAPVTRADDAPDVVTYGRREDVQAFAKLVAERNSLDPDWTARQ